ncbi:MAG: hypothetical protein EAZ57_06690 [Cytophagales bacterium]|nr:MAG: hypothetical protein EAZ67_07845 [Cytophagales bacterium]TAF60547.1 MAG: hypothetical protein EAZ57_06690 [Cytophagales bacterium]
MKKLFFIVCLMLAFKNLPLWAQETIDPEIAFKMHIFMGKTDGFEGEYKIIRDSGLIKRHQIFKAFYDSTTFSIDTLDAASSFGNGICFFRVKKITFRQGYDCPLELLRFADETRFILAIDQKFSAVYRLGGFRENDFFQMLADVKRSEKISTRYFLYNKRVNDLDFRCLYIAIRKIILIFPL